MRKCGTGITLQGKVSPVTVEEGGELELLGWQVALQIIHLAGHRAQPHTCYTGCHIASPWWASLVGH